jgi:hypothetical protein
MIPGVQPKLLLNLDTEEPKYKLVRERDNLTKQSARIMWVEWNEDGTFKDKYDEPAIGRITYVSIQSILYLANNYYYRNRGGAR